MHIWYDNIYNVQIFRASLFYKLQEQQLNHEK